MEGTAATKLSNLDTKMSLASSEHRARQAVAAAAQAAQASPHSSQFSPNRAPHLEPLSPKTRLAPPPQKKRCCARLLTSMQDYCEYFRRFSEKYKVREIGLMALGLASLVFLLTALGGPEPQPFAAVIAALLGWLTVYTYMLQAECLRLMTMVQGLQNRAGDHRTDQDRLDLEMAHIYNAHELLRPGYQSQRAVQSVLTASLVNDYLRLQSALRIYAERFGPIAEVGMHWNLDKTLVASVIQETSCSRDGQGDLADAASQVGDLPNVHCHSPRDVSLESPYPVPTAPAQQSAQSNGMAEAISKTIASIEDSMNLPSWLKQIRH